ncbi:MAG TPA: hypothetical protein VHZ54_15960 [Solirubrobacterales bacterium]|nr:hypothetical protein [Solirubrobacterales bacterium]
MYKRKIAAALFALVALVAVIAGCGGGGSSDTTGGGTTAETGGSSESSGAAPTKAAFIKEGDKICTDDENELNKEVEVFAKENNLDLEKDELSTDQETELFQEVVLPNIAKQAEDLAELTPPEGDEETIEELTDTLSSEVEEAEDAGGKPSEDTLAGATKMAKAYGFKSCGS